MLRLETKDDPVSTPVATPSSNRQALAVHLAALAAARDKAQHLQDVQTLATVAADAEHAAQLALDGVFVCEKDDIDRWALRGAEGSPPPPRTKDREAASARLAEARKQAEQAKRAAEGVTPEHLKTIEAYNELARAAPGLMSAVLLEEAERLGEKYAAAWAGANTCLVILDSLAGQAMQLGEGRAVGQVQKIINDARRRDAKEHHACVRELWDALAGRLATDAFATIEASEEL